MTTPTNNHVVSLLNTILNTDDICRVIVGSDLSPENMAKLHDYCEASLARQIIPDVYIIAEPDGAWAYCSGHDSLPQPYPHQLAWGICRARGWRMALPMSVARFLLAIDERPMAYTVGAIPYDRLKPFSVRGLLNLEPGHHDLFGGVGVAGQALISALPHDASRDELRAIGETAARGVISAETFLSPLREDVALNLLGDRERFVAEIILESVAGRTGQALRGAPGSFVPPDHAPIVNGWAIGSRDGDECLIAVAVSGHPLIEDGHRLISSALIWIDEEAGWARTESRHYRLGRRLSPGNATGHA